MFQLFKKAASSITNAAVGKVKLFVDTDGTPKTKDENGVIKSFTTNGLTSFNGRSDTSVIPQKVDYITFYQTTFFLNMQDYGILTTNTGTVNSLVFNSLYAVIPDNSIMYFPDGVYEFDSELLLNRNIKLTIKGSGKGKTILRSVSIINNLFNISVNSYYNSFEDLTIDSSVAKTNGSFITTNSSTGDNAFLDIRRCEFKNYFIGINLTGISAGNKGTISDCILSDPALNAKGIVIDGLQINININNTIID